MLCIDDDAMLILILLKLSSIHTNFLKHLNLDKKGFEKNSGKLFKRGYFQYLKKEKKNQKNYKLQEIRRGQKKLKKVISRNSLNTEFEMFFQNLLNDISTIPEENIPENNQNNQPMKSIIK